MPQNVLAPPPPLPPPPPTAATAATAAAAAAATTAGAAAATTAGAAAAATAGAAAAATKTGAGAVASPGTAASARSYDPQVVVLVRGEPLSVRVNGSGQTKVAETHVACAVEEHILRLEISINVPGLMYCFQCKEDLCCIESHARFRERALAPQMEEELCGSKNSSHEQTSNRETKARPTTQVRAGRWFKRQAVL